MKFKKIVRISNLFGRYSTDVRNSKLAKFVQNATVYHRYSTGAKSSFHMPLDSQLTVKLAIVAYLYTVQIFSGIFGRWKFPMADEGTGKF